MRILETASNAVSAAEDRLAISAQNVAGMGRSLEDGTAKEPDLVREAAGRVEDSAAIKANLAVIRGESERVGHLIDIFV
ncbi:MAG: hypothetical protein PHU25_16450 [Deltaproteobacteria bacterium]|nr:hypothetical protein [Deltaproteobacteria bacterium]